MRRKSDCSRELKTLESVRSQTLELARGLSQEELDFSTSSSVWSVGEIVDHILLAEKLYRGEIVELVRLARAGKPPRLRRTFKDVDVSLFFIPKSVLPVLETPFTIFNYFVPGPMRELVTRYALIPAKHPGLAEPSKKRPADELLSDLVISVAQTREVIEANRDLDFTSMVHEHPLMGSNNVPQLLRFIAIHERRHQEQIHKAISSLPD